ncbi:MAG: hypothetical protein WDA27_15370, partial [Actinomycetota bacterium]
MGALLSAAAGGSARAKLTLDRPTAASAINQLPKLRRVTFAIFLRRASHSVYTHEFNELHATLAATE